MKAMPDQLILKRNPDATYVESYNVLFEGRHVGPHYKAVSHAPREAPWFWGLEFHEWQGSDGPHLPQCCALPQSMTLNRPLTVFRHDCHSLLSSCSL
jgi:hypothetical protein